MESSYYHLFWAYTAFFLIIHFMILLMLKSVKITAQRLNGRNNSGLGKRVTDEDKGN